MKITSIVLIVGVLFSGCAATKQEKPATKSVSASWPWPDSLDAVQAAPKNHKVLYEDEKVRILEVTVRPGEKENLHHHRWPSVLVIDSQPKCRDILSDGSIAAIDEPTPETPMPLIIRIGPQKLHAVENLGTRSVHIYRIETKTARLTN